MSEQKRLRILCFGNPLHGDDGFGPTVGLALRRKALPPGVEVVDCGTRGLDALHLFEDCTNLIIIDAMAGERPGTLHELSPHQVPVENAGSGGHGAGVGYLLAAVREMITKPPLIKIIAVEIGAVKSFSPGLSLEVAAAVSEAIELIQNCCAAMAGHDPDELVNELDMLRQANQALEAELTKCTEALDQLISEQENQKDELRYRSQELARLQGTVDRAIDTMAEIIVMLGPDGRVTRVNRLLEIELGYTPESLVKGYFEDCLLLASQNALRALLPAGAKPPLLLNAIRAAGGHFVAELNFRRADATSDHDTEGSVPYLVHASLIHSQAGKLEGAIVISTNISVLKAREKALRNNERQLHETAEELRNHRDNLAAMVEEQTRDLRLAKEQAEDASRAKSDFLSNMSHEVRTPLNAILGLSDICLLTPLNPQQNQYLSKIRLAADHLLGIINDILDFSRIEAGKLSIEKLSFELPVLLEEISDLLIGRIEEKNLELCVDIAAEATRSFVGDPLRLKQIIINLLGNAIKFSDKGSILLGCSLESTERSGSLLHFSVTDEGIGISQAQQDMLFSAFSQADTSTTRRFGGSGLGLVISKRLVELMDGRIWLESEAGKGSTFHFTVRLDNAPDAPLLLDQLRSHLAPHAGRTLLIVDDNPVAARTLATQCRQLGLQTETCPSGESALTALTRPGTHYLAVLVDWHLPVGMDGLETVKAIRSMLGTQAPPLILMSAQKTSDASILRDQPADALLLKPSSVRHLYAAIARPLNLPEIAMQALAAPALDLSGIALLSNTDILVVDDIELNRDLMRELFATAGLNIRLASNGREAIVAIHQKKPDLVLMDCQMPIMDGFTATRQLRAQPQYATLPIIALTAGALDHDREQCLAAGMNAYVTKPVNLEKLLRVIADQLSLGAVPPMPERPAPLPPPPNAATPAPRPETTKLPELPGIDVAGGLMRVRNKADFYCRMLIKFRDTHGAALSAELRAALDDGNRPEAIRLAHSVKGIALSLGIDGLGERALNLEMKLKDPTATDVSAEVELLLSELAKIRQVLQALG
ncbi:hydrogenase maturation protease [Ferribacterium limneticum]|uniref:hydrogenase maturation protease n=1 Tax=Ferribacterium limneticum TaxID=76259 RepID=UPI001CF9854C|nr:hydrogenase maturation protease [Ferribacterium limneticum]UCV29783.1 hydrogenase maturation protease [Ferribacterium limneticum]UCV33702.1 hydrogenase maturation protease [Ferribacterium limneticum]